MNDTVTLTILGLSILFLVGTIAYNYGYTSGMRDGSIWESRRRIE